MPDCTTQKYLASAFLIMTFLSAPIWFFSAVGSGLAEEDTKNDAVGWSALTIGNARTGAAPGVNATHALELALFGGSVTGKEVSYAIMMSDLCMGLFFIGFIFFVRHKVRTVPRWLPQRLDTHAPCRPPPHRRWTVLSKRRTPTT